MTHNYIQFIGDKHTVNICTSIFVIRIFIFTAYQQIQERRYVDCGERVRITKNTNIKLSHILTIFESPLKCILITIGLLQRNSQICIVLCTVALVL